MSNLHLLRFGEYSLPLDNPTTPVGPPLAHAPITQLPRGMMFDELGSSQAEPQLPFDLNYSALLRADHHLDLEELLHQWRGLTGARAALYRRTYGEQWAWARLLEVRAEREAAHWLEMPVEFLFQVQSSWYGVKRDVDAANIATASPKSFTMPNVGNLPVTDILFRFTVGGSSTPSVSNVSVYRSGYSEINYTEPLTNGQYVEIDFGARSVKKGAADDYDNFTATDYDGEHWLKIPAGGGTVFVAWTVASGTVTPSVTFDYYDRWA